MPLDESYVWCLLVPGMSFMTHRVVSGSTSFQTMIIVIDYLKLHKSVRINITLLIILVHGLFCGRFGFVSRSMSRSK